MDSNTLPVTGILISTIISLLFYLVFSIGQKVRAGYQQGKTLDTITGNTDTGGRHWLFGDMVKYDLRTKEGRDQAQQRFTAHPKMFNIWFSIARSMLFVYHPESTGPLLKSKHTVTCKAPTGYRFASPWIGNGLVSSCGTHWARHRKMITPAFHFKLLKSYAKIFNASAKVLVEKWKKTINVPVEVQQPMGLMAMESLLKCAMSVKEDLQNMNSTDNNPTVKYMQAVSDMQEIIVTRNRTALYYYDWVFQWSALAKKQRAVVKVLDDYANDVITEREKRRLQQGATSDSEAKDFLDILFNARDEKGNGLRTDEMKDEVATFLFAGHDTTTSAMSWCLYNLAMHPELQEKCRDEVDEVLRDNDTVEWDHLNKFEYLSMFMKESLRLFPTVYGIARQMNENLDVIPKDTTVTVSIVTQHKHQSLWENPDVFDPERFSTENRKNIPNLAYIPFSAGPRNCIGQQFALNEIKITIALLLKSFRIYRDEETPEPNPQMKMIYTSENGIFVKLEPLPKQE